MQTNVQTMKEPETKSSKNINKEINALLTHQDFVDIQFDKHQPITFGNFLSDKLMIIAAIRKGIPFSLFNEIQAKTPFNDSDWAEFLGISLKSLQRYKQSEKHIFKSTQSEKIIEIAEVTNAGIDLFKSMEKFKLWLNTPNYALGNFKPMELLKDSYGKEMVINELTRIEHGIFI